MEKKRYNLESDQSPEVKHSLTRTFIKQLLCTNHSEMNSYLSYMCAKSLQSCPTLCNPRECSPSGSSVHGILQTRIIHAGSKYIGFSHISQYNLFINKNSLQLQVNQMISSFSCYSEAKSKFQKEYIYIYIYVQVYIHVSVR